MGRVHPARLRRLSEEQLEAMMDDESLTEAEFEMVQAESNRRESEDYMNEATWGADGTDDDESRRFNRDPHSIVNGYGMIDGFQPV